MATQPADYCREIETYLCRKNDGHLIRVVGPSFELVSHWERQGIPLKIAFQGIDRYFERYYRRGPRRRPVKVDFCEADVLDVFDEWRRAVGLARAVDASDAASDAAVGERSAESLALRVKRSSLPEHLERVVTRLSSARANGSLVDEFDDVIDGVSRELDAARSKVRGLRGEARQALIDRLRNLDAELLRQARSRFDEPTRAALAREADEELAAFRAVMPADAFARAREAAIDRLVRERFALPTVAFVG
ncbi:MAG: hypothetical protein DMG01_21925 [Acidobacteria bacterium]|nr:MAG: hypothetical protein DMG01_21925 [Acidobacteriota bacterium]